MESIKCHQCGLVSWPDKEIVSCQRCGGPIWQKNEYGAGFKALETSEKSLFSGVIKFLTIFLGVGLLILVGSRLLNLAGTSAGNGVGFILLFVGAIFAIGVKFWFLKQVFSESVGWGLASIFLPFGALIALIKFWNKTHRPFVAHLLSMGIALVGILTLGYPRL